MQPAFRDPTAFAEAFLPPRFVNRENEISRLRSCLMPVVQQRPVKHVWIHGQPGTGKTSVAKFLLNELEDRHGIRGVYVNCWETETFYGVLDKLVRDFRLLGAERLSTLFKMERLEKHLTGKPLLVVLDEIDKPSPKERDRIIYSFCSIPNVALVCVCNSRYFFYTLDSRVRSRLNPILMEFRPYASEQIMEILRQRAELGFGGEAIQELVLKKIANISEGDARIAIQTLRHAMIQTEQHGGKILSAHLKSGYAAARNAKKKYLIARLTDHHRLIYQLIQTETEIQSGPLWKEYLEHCNRLRWQPVASRTFTLYLKQLEQLELVTHRRALGIKGNVRIFQMRE
ncbi:MAG: orc1/cdc6 family replication initiation protein [Acidobacteria bacterium]|nr:orc1/cdc6 family replication initiation protein [Acidobacteriota bacterium]